MAGLTESVVEDAALAWLESLGYAIKHGPDALCVKSFGLKVRRDPNIGFDEMRDLTDQQRAFTLSIAA